MGRASRRKRERAEQLELVDGPHVYLRMVREAAQRGNIPEGAYSCSVMHEDGCAKMKEPAGVCACAPHVMLTMQDGRRYVVDAAGGLELLSRH